MPLNVGEIQAILSLERADFLKGIQEVQSATAGLGNKFEQQMKPVQEAAERVNGALRGLKLALIGLAGSQVVQGINNAAKAAFQAQAGAEIFAKMLERVGESASVVMPRVEALAQELRLPATVIQQNAAELLRAGYNWQQIEDIYRGAAASALLVGESTQRGVEASTAALVTQISRYLDTIGIVQNLGVAFQKYAQEHGKTVDQLDAAERAEAAHQMILKATAQEVQDMPRLLEGYGGAVSDLSAAMYQLKISLGETLLPIVTQIVKGMGSMAQSAASMVKELKAISEPISTALKPFTEWVKENADVVMPGLAAAITALLVPAFYALATSIGAAVIAAGPFLAIAGALGLAVSGGVALWKKYGDNIKGALKGVGANLSDLGDQVASAFSSIPETGKDLLAAFQDKIRAMLDWLSTKKAHFQAAWDSIAGGLSSAFEGAVGGVKAAFGTAINAVIGVVNSVIERINKIKITIPKWVPRIGGEEWGPSIATLAPIQLQQGALLPGVGGADSIPAFLAPGEAVVPADVVRAGAGAVVEWFRRMGAQGFQEGGIAGQRGLSTAVVEAASASATWLKAAVSDIGQGLQVAGQQLASGVQQFITDPLGSLGTAFRWLDVQALNVAKGLADVGRNVAQGLWSAVQQRAPILGQMVQGASSMAGGGPMAMLAGALLPLLTNSKMFAGAMVWINQLLGKLSDTVGRLLGALAPLIQVVLSVVGTLMTALEPIINVLAQTIGALFVALAPVIQIVGAVLAPILGVLGALIEALVVPALKALFPVIKAFGLILGGAAWVIGQIWNGLISVVQAVFRALGNIEIFGWKPLAFLNDWANSLEGAKMDTDAIAKSLVELAGLTLEQAQATAQNIAAQMEAAAATKEFAEQLTNVPTGFKVELLRYESMTAVPMQSGGIVTSPTLALVGERGPEAVVPLGGDGASLGGITIVFEGPVYGFNDFEEKVMRAVDKATAQRNLRTGGTIVQRAPQFVG